MKQLAVLLRDVNQPHIWAPDVRDGFAQSLQVVGVAEPGDWRAAGLAEANVLLTSWGSPKWDAAFFEAAPKLELILYAAGSVRGYVDEAFWSRGVRLSSAWRMNAVPVVEFTLAQILLSLKRFWSQERATRGNRRFTREPVPGAFGTRVGIVSLGAIGRGAASRLQGFDVDVLAYDPFVAPEEVRRLGAEPVSLQRIFAESDVVSVHTPWLPETVGLVSEPLIASMKQGATLINTSRGAVLDEPGLLRVLNARPDLVAVLDVTYPEPPPDDSPLYTLPNVVLTPHIAGALDGETRRFGLEMLAEAQRWLAGQPLLHEVTRESFERMA